MCCLNSSSWLGTSPIRRMLDKRIHEVSTSTTGWTLDIGVGVGRYKGLFKRYVGIDLRPTGAISVIADAHNLPFRDFAFETVLCTAMLEHVWNPSVVVMEIKRVLALEGTVLAWVPFVVPMHDLPRDYWRFTKEGSRRLFQNLKICQIRSSGGFFSTIEMISWSVITYLHRKVGILSMTLLPIHMMFQLLSKLDRFDSLQYLSPGYLLICEREENTTIDR